MHLFRQVIPIDSSFIRCSSGFNSCDPLLFTMIDHNRKRAFESQFQRMNEWSLPYTKYITKIKKNTR